MPVIQRACSAAEMMSYGGANSADSSGKPRLVITQGTKGANDGHLSLLRRDCCLSIVDSGFGIQAGVLPVRYHRKACEQRLCPCQSVLTAHYSLLTAYCSLLTTHCLLLTAHHSLFTAHYSLLTIHCSLFTAHYSLLTAHYLLLTTYCSLLTAHCSPLTTHYLLFTAPVLL